MVALLQSMESQLQRERQRRMEEEMRGKKEQERREEAEEGGKHVAIRVVITSCSR